MTRRKMWQSILEVGAVDIVCLLEKLNMDTPKQQKSVRDGTKAKVTEAEDFEHGLDEWEKSFKADIEEGGFQQAWVDHFRSLRYLHKTHMKPKESADKKDAKKEVIKRIVASASLLTKIHPEEANDETHTLDAMYAGQVASTAAVGSAATGAKSSKKDKKGAAEANVSAATAGAVVSSSSSSDVSEKELKKIKESDGSQVVYYINEKFKNWGLTVQNKPSVTFAPVSVGGVQNIVKWATSKGLRVRASGYRHTWSDMYSEDGAVLITMLPLKEATRIPVFREPKIKPNLDDLEGIKIVGEIDDNGSKKGLCRIGASTTNDQFRAWCLDDSENGGKWNWTIPLNVIMVEITWGGSNSPICHGAGIKHETLSDLVTEIEFVNPKGEVQKVNDRELLRAASGAFGLLGIVTAVTVKLDPMTYAAMHPTKTPVMLSIPPPEGWQIPSDLDKGFSPSQLAKAKADFIYHCEHDYYSEWFWFPYREETWNNCWHNDGKKEDAKTIPEWKVLSQDLQGFLGNTFNETLGRLSPKLQTWTLAWSAMAVLPDLTGKPPAVVPLIEALHFRRGIQNMRVVDMELEIPIPGRKDDPTKPDWGICQHAWWSVINLAYEYKKNGKYPLRVALEMRIMGGSNVIMAPQYGNTKDGNFGTCSIEVLTTPQTDADLWNEFMQKVATIWCSYKGLNKAKLNTRSHWAKQWQSLTYDGKDAVTHYKTVAYKDRIPEFVKTLKKVAKVGGFSWDDMKARFSNPLLDRIYFE
jgi:hypothetical protein